MKSFERSTESVLSDSQRRTADLCFQRTSMAMEQGAHAASLAKKEVSFSRAKDGSWVASSKQI